MGFATFIAGRILRPDTAGSASERDPGERMGISRPIVLIAVLGIVVGMAVMILTVGIASGFQREVRAKVLGAGGHLQLGAIGQTDPKETLRLLRDPELLHGLDTTPGIAHVQAIALRPGIIETSDGIEGVVVKGVEADFDGRFLQAHLEAGALPALGGDTLRNELLLSRYLARRLLIDLHDTITVYLVQGRDNIRPRRFRVCGIYSTALEQLDHQVVLVDMRHLQRAAQWGLKAELLVSDTVADAGIRVQALGFGGDRIHQFEWPGGTFRGPGPFWIRTTRDTTVHVVLHDAAGTVPDTAWVRIEPLVPGKDGMPLRHDQVRITTGGSGGSDRHYVGAFEVLLKDPRQLEEMDQYVYRHLLPANMRSLSARDRFPEIFGWLELLDTNVWVVIVLMVVVAIINMASALLVLILERTRMIGVLKAMGASDSLMRRVFLLVAAMILSVGILLGDVVGVGLCLLQKHFGIVKLPMESYYVDAVPVDLAFTPILLLNVGTLVVCIAALLLPSMLVARIVPARTIRFD